MASWGALRFALFRGDQEKSREISPEVMRNIHSDAPFHVASAGLWLRRDNQGEITGLDDRCTHLGCRQKWNAERGIFECLCHGSEFDIHGNVLRGPAKEAIPAFALEVTANDKVRIFRKS
jgi:Rieske Fe-S protein